MAGLGVLLFKKSSRYYFHSGTLSLPCGASSEPCLLTTCVGSARELTQLANRAQRPGCLPLGPCAIRALFYFMRCSQLENRTSGDVSQGMIMSSQHPNGKIIDVHTRSILYSLL